MASAVPSDHDNTGLQLCGAGKWLLEKHGPRARRSWRTLQISVEADTGQIASASLTAKKADDGAEVAPLLGQVAGTAASFIGDSG